MDALERLHNNWQQAFRTAMDGNQSMLWTAMPGIIGSFDPATLTATVQVAHRLIFTGPDKVDVEVNIPPLPDVPIIFAHGGTYAQTFPIQAGDECLVVFASRCIDNWWSQGGVQTPTDNRMHDLSDGFALVGPWSQKNKIQNVSTDTAQFRTNDGSIAITLDQPNKQASIISNGMTIMVDGNANSATIKADNITLNGTVTVDGDVHVNGNITATGTITP